MEQPCYMSALILTEDGSAGAFDTVHSLLKHILLAIDPSTQTHVIQFEPSADPDARAALSGNRWREGRGPLYRQLLGAIASKLAEPGGFVFFHFDGDTKWTNRDACLTREQFDELVVRKIPEFIRTRLEARNKKAREKGKPGISQADIETVVANAIPRLFPVVPHYSIESWCYQNTQRARELCARSHGGNAWCAQCDEWGKNRALLDEVEKVKEECRLRSDHNADLASEQFPRPDVVAAGTSFASAVQECKREPLTSTLAMTYAYPRPPSVC